MRRGNPLTAALVVALAIVWGAGGVLLSRQLSRGHEARLAETVAAVKALVEDAQESLRLDAALLARDVLIVEGDIKGEWYTMSSPQRTFAFAVGRRAELLLIIDPAGNPIVRVAGTAIPRIDPPEKPTGTLRILDDRAYLLGIASFAGMRRSGGAVPGARGVVILARRLENLGPSLGRLASRPAVVVVEGDRAVSPTLPHAPDSGWDAAARAGSTVINHEPWALRPVSQLSGATLWALVPEKDYETERRRLRFWLFGSLAVAASLVVAIAWAVNRRPATRS